MDAAGYATLNRQSGLMREMQVVANNIANVSTTGFRREGVVFSEYRRRGWTASRRCRWPMRSGRHVDLTQAALTPDRRHLRLCASRAMASS